MQQLQALGGSSHVLSRTRSLPLSWAVSRRIGNRSRFRVGLKAIFLCRVIALSITTNYPRGSSCSEESPAPTCVACQVDTCSLRFICALGNAIPLVRAWDGRVRNGRWSADNHQDLPCSHVFRASHRYISTRQHWTDMRRKMIRLCNPPRTAHTGKTAQKVMDG